jgi:hypothetical protein
MTRMRIGAFAVLTLTATVALAADLPPLKSGMWKFDRTVNRSDQPDKPEKLSTQACTNPADDMKVQQEQLVKSGCTTTPPEQKVDTFSFTWSCALPNGATGTGKSAITYSSDTAYSATFESDARHEGRRISTSETLKATRIGDCPK